MCQTNNIQRRFTAGTICYKVLRKNLLYGYSSLYQKMFWKLGQTYKTSFYNLSINQIKEYYRSFNKIEFGFFHAFPTLDEAIKFQKTIFCPSFDYVITNFPIAEMQIPENVDGFSGTYSDFDGIFDSIAVPILKFVKIVDQNVSDKQCSS